MNATHFAHVLASRRLDLFGGCLWFETPQGGDVPAHGITLGTSAGIGAEDRTFGSVLAPGEGKPHTNGDDGQAANTPDELEAFR